MYTVQSMFLLILLFGIYDFRMPLYRANDVNVIISHIKDLAWGQKL